MLPRDGLDVGRCHRRHLLAVLVQEVEPQPEPLGGEQLGRHLGVGRQLERQAAEQVLLGVLDLLWGRQLVADLADLGEEPFLRHGELVREGADVPGKRPRLVAGRAGDLGSDGVRQPLPVAQVGREPVGEPRPGAQHVVHHQEGVVVRVVSLDAEVADEDVRLGRGLVGDDFDRRLLGRRRGRHLGLIGTGLLPVGGQLLDRLRHLGGVEVPDHDDDGPVRGECVGVERLQVVAGQLLHDLLLAGGRSAKRVVAIDQRTE